MTDYVQAKERRWLASFENCISASTHRIEDNVKKKQEILITAENNISKINTDKTQKTKMGK